MCNLIFPNPSSKGEEPCKRKKIEDLCLTFDTPDGEKTKVLIP